MRLVMMGLLVLVLSSFVIAQGSETTAEFNIGTVEVGRDYVPSYTFWDLYGTYVVGAIIVLIVVAILIKKKGLTRKGVPSRKGTKVPSSSGKKTKARKVSHGKIAKKKVKKKSKK